MPTFDLAPSALLAAVLTMAFSTLAHAQTARTWVATTGTDSGTCQRTAPCRTFNYAQGWTTTGGEVIAVDSGTYPAVTVSKSITLMAPDGVHAVISPGTHHSAVEIYASAGSSVTLRNLSIVNDNPSAQYGVAFYSGAELTVDRCRVSGFNGNGVSATLSAEGRLYVRHSVIRNNSNVGLKLMTSSGVLRTTVASSVFEKNGYGVMGLGNTETTVRDSTASDNTTGFYTGNTSAQLTLESCVANGNNMAVSAEYGLLRVSNTTVVNSLVLGLYVGKGQLLSFGNNRIHGNATNGAFTSTVTLQ
jgi:hypothetical protein